MTEKRDINAEREEDRGQWRGEESKMREKQNTAEKLDTELGTRAERPENRERDAKAPESVRHFTILNHIT